MQYNEFIRHVQEQANLAAPEEAVRLTEVVLAALGERLYRTERDSLVAQLPKELNPMLYARQDRENTRRDVQRFSAEEFYNRVSARLEISYSQAKIQAKAVVSTLQQAVSAEEFNKTMDTLPEEFAELMR